MSGGGDRDEKAQGLLFWQIEIDVIKDLKTRLERIIGVGGGLVIGESHFLERLVFLG